MPLYNKDDLNFAEELALDLFPQLKSKPLLRKAIASNVVFAAALERVDGELDEIADEFLAYDGELDNLTNAMATIASGIVDIQRRLSKLEAVTFS